MIRRNIFFILLFSLIFTTAASATPNYQEGLWEITTTMDIPGMPKEMKKPLKYTFCMTKQNAVPQQKKQGEQKCEMTNQRMEGNTVHWTMTCKDGTVTTGEITYDKTTFKGSQNTTTKRGSQKMTFQTTMDGKYLGPCKK